MYNRETALVFTKYEKLTTSISYPRSFLIGGRGGAIPPGLLYCSCCQIEHKTIDWHRNVIKIRKFAIQ